MKKRGVLVILLIVLLLLVTNVLAHGDEEDEEVNLEEYLRETSITYIIYASVILVILVMVLFIKKEQSNNFKIAMFVFITLIIILPTLYISFGTFYLNKTSLTKGPVHWHADFEIWNCDEKLDLVDPEGFSNRIGNPVFHEHGDDRIHVEGVVVDKNEVNLDEFFHVIGGHITQDNVEIPTTKGYLHSRNRDLCSNKEGKVQVFVYKTYGSVYTQEKLDEYENYVLSPYSNVPPGDCIIVEFDEEKEKTEHICSTYKSAIERGVIYGG
ncbi:MAG: hypothetical protein HYS32_03625 [Candidatus Woesearchaeota archaeon]|nr:MAG: hypothetical protein HYS32_03625 [Candidatus Woesearchaeota archaeon]